MPITTTRPTATATMRHGLESAPAGPAGPVVGPLDAGRGLIRATRTLIAATIVPSVTTFTVAISIRSSDLTGFPSPDTCLLKYASSGGML